MNQIIEPQRKRCDCGSQVTSHHWKCNKCWGKKAKEKHWKKIKKINKKKPKTYDNYNKLIRKE